MIKDGYLERIRRLSSDFVGGSSRGISVIRLGSSSKVYITRQSVQNLEMND